MTDNKLNATIKAGKDYDAPWLTVGGESQEELDYHLQALVESDSLAAIAKLAKKLGALWTVSKVLGGEPTQEQTPAPQYEQPQQYQQAALATPQQQQGNPWAPNPGAATGYAQSAANEAWRSDPTIQPPHLVPPMTQFGPAKYKGGFAGPNAKNPGAPYRIWSDPRPWAQIKTLPKEQTFSQFISDKELG